MGNLIGVNSSLLEYWVLGGIIFLWNVSFVHDM